MLTIALCMLNYAKMLLFMLTSVLLINQAIKGGLLPICSTQRERLSEEAFYDIFRHYT